MVLIFNCDGDSTTLSHFEPPMRPEQMCRPLDELAGTGVTAFACCLNRGDDTFSHRTAVGEIYGSNVTDWRAPERYRNEPGAEGCQRKMSAMRRIAENTRAVLDAGGDPVAVLAARAKTLGIRFWASLRMNDIHEDDGKRFFVLRSEFKKRHPELLIGSPYPDPAAGYGEEDFTWAFDFARPEVRDRKLAIIEEACLRYDLNGFELDFQRGPWFFKRGRESAEAERMTEFLRRVRSRTVAIAEAKGRAFTLAVRVPPTFEAGLSKGLEVRGWITEELADVFIAMDGGYLDMGADVRAFAAAAKGKRCMVMGGIEPYTKGYGASDPRMMRAAAAGYYEQGAQGVYLFNFDCHRSRGRDNDYTAWERQALKDLGDPSAIAFSDKRYTITRDMAERTPQEGGDKPLPVEITPPARRTFRLTIGDDPNSGRNRNVELRIRSSHGVLAVEFNGRQTAVGGIRDGVCIFPDPPIVRGENVITIGVSEGHSRPARIEGIELAVNYS